MTAAGTRPRSLTVNPFSRAQERTATLLGELTDRDAVSSWDFPASACVAGALLADFLTGDVLLLLLLSFLACVAAFFFAGLLGACSSPDNQRDAVQRAYNPHGVLERFVGIKG